MFQMFLNASISNDFDIHFCRKCIHNKISSSPPKTMGTCGNVGFLGGEDETVIYVKNKVPESLT